MAVDKLCGQWVSGLELVSYEFYVSCCYFEWYEKLMINWISIWFYSEEYVMSDNIYYT